MLRRFYFKEFIFVSTALISVGSSADVIELPDEELAKESVLPVFDKTMVVRERAVKTAGRIELGGGIGSNLAEPLYGQLAFDVLATYHLDEVHGVNFLGVFLSTDLSAAGKDLQAGKGMSNGGTFDASRAPKLENLLFGNYEFTAYYGKMSMTKHSTMNLSLYGNLGLGLANWTDSMSFAVDVGVGQKVYFTKNVGLRVDLFFAMYSGPDPTDPNTTSNDLSAGGAELGSDQFASTYYIRPFLTGSFIVLF